MIAKTVPTDATEVATGLSWHPQLLNSIAIGILYNGTGVILSLKAASWVSVLNCWPLLSRQLFLQLPAHHCRACASYASSGTTRKSNKITGLADVPAVWQIELATVTGGGRAKEQRGERRGIYSRTIRTPFELWHRSTVAMSL